MAKALLDQARKENDHWSCAGTKLGQEKEVEGPSLLFIRQILSRAERASEEHLALHTWQVKGKKGK